MKKRQILLCLACFLVISVTGCGVKQEAAMSVEKTAVDEEPAEKKEPEPIEEEGPEKEEEPEEEEPEQEEPEQEEEELLAQYSVEQAQEIMYSLTGTQVNISQAEKNGIVEVDLLWGDGFYIECEDWNAEYAGNNTWRVSCQICDIERYDYKMGKVTYTVIENPDSIFDGYSITDMQAAPVSLLNWQ